MYKERNGLEMFILTNINDEIFNISETKGYQENGNYLMNGGMVGETAIPQNQVKGIRSE